MEAALGFINCYKEILTKNKLKLCLSCFRKPQISECKCSWYKLFLHSQQSTLPYCGVSNFVKHVDLVQLNSYSGCSASDWHEERG